MRQVHNTQKLLPRSRRVIAEDQPAGVAVSRRVEATVGEQLASAATGLRGGQVSQVITELLGEVEGELDAAEWGEFVQPPPHRHGSLPELQLDGHREMLRGLPEPVERRQRSKGVP